MEKDKYIKILKMLKKFILLLLIVSSILKRASLDGEIQWDALLMVSIFAYLGKKLTIH